jgi:hypothetical protein
MAEANRVVGVARQEEGENGLDSHIDGSPWMEDMPWRLWIIRGTLRPSKGGWLSGLLSRMLP